MEKTGSVFFFFLSEAKFGVYVTIDKLKENEKIDSFFLILNLLLLLLFTLKVHRLIYFYNKVGNNMFQHAKDFIFSLRNYETPLC
jgi:hypothetical protein